MQRKTTSARSLAYCVCFVELVFVVSDLDACYSVRHPPLMYERYAQRVVRVELKKKAVQCFAETACQSGRANLENS